MRSLALFVMAFAVPQSGFAEAFSDNFDRADTVSADEQQAPCPLGKKYRITSGKWSISGGELLPEGNTSKNLLITSPEMTEDPFTVEVDFLLENPEADKCSAGFLIYQQDSGGGGLARFRGGEPHRMQLSFTKDERTKTDALPIPENLQSHTWYRFTVKFSPQTGYDYLLTKRDSPDQTVLSGQLKNPKMFTSGKPGLYASSPTRVRFDNFSYRRE